MSNMIIGDFKLTISISRVYYGRDDEFMARLASTIYDSVLSLVQTAGFYNDMSIDDVVEQHALKVTYNDDSNGFELFCTRDSIIITRQSCRWDEFREWFNAIMPHIPEQLTSITTKMKDLGGRIIKVRKVEYSFRFICFEMKCPSAPGGVGKLVTNHAVMEKLISNVPDDGGAVCNLKQQNVTNVARLDYNVHAWTKTKSGGIRNVVYKVEAPYNRNSSSIWFTFLYRNGDYRSPNGIVHQVSDPQELIQDFESALSWCETQCLNRFMQDVMTGLEYKMSSSTLWAT